MIRSITVLRTVLTSCALVCFTVGFLMLAQRALGDDPILQGECAVIPACSNYGGPNCPDASTCENAGSGCGCGWGGDLFEPCDCYLETGGG